MAHKRNIEHIVDKATRGYNILDLIFTHVSCSGIEVTTVPAPSDHNVITTNTELT